MDPSKVLMGVLVLVALTALLLVSGQSRIQQIRSKAKAEKLRSLFIAGLDPRRNDEDFVRMMLSTPAATFQGVRVSYHEKEHRLEIRDKAIPILLYLAFEVKEGRWQCVHEDGDKRLTLILDAKAFCGYIV